MADTKKMIFSFLFFIIFNISQIINTNKDQPHYYWVESVDIKLDSYRARKELLYIQSNKKAALKLYKQSESVNETVRASGSPALKQLYNWIYEEKHLPKWRKKYTNVENPPYHPRNPSLDVKLDAIHRRF